MQNKINLDDFESLIFVYNNGEFARVEVNQLTIKKVIPDKLGYSYSPIFQENAVLGRFSPIHMYTGGTDETIAFNISMHEDLLDKNRFPTIIDFVDEIKSLSYPRLNSNNILVFPRVYFQLGKIAGYGIINTGITWNKPIRDGRYITADISFSINIEDVVTTPIVSIKETAVEGLEKEFPVYFSDKVLSDKFESHYSYIYKSRDSFSEMLERSKKDYNNFYSEHIKDFISSTHQLDWFSSFESESLLEKQKDILFKQVQLEAARLERLYGAFKIANDEAAKNLIKIEEIFNSYKGNKAENNRAVFFNADKKTKVFGITLDSKLYLSSLSKSDYMKEIDGFLEAYIESNLDSRFNGSEEDADKFKKEVRTAVLDIYANIYELYRGTLEYGSGS